MSGPDKAGVYFNRPWLDFTGRPVERELGDGWIEAVHPEDRPALEACGEAFAARRPFRTEFRLRRHDGEWRWMLDTGVPRFAPDGAFAGYIGSCVDITERKQAEERRTLLLNELNHRVKNTLATVQSLAAQTLRGAPSPEAFRAAFEARLVALSNTHDLLTRDSWAGAHLRDILEAEMAPYADGGGGPGEASPSSRIVLRGAAVRLAPKAALTLGMAFHELATNAAKYGALSAPTGRVEVSWEIRAVDGARRLRLDWREAGGPPVEVPRRRGFGSRLVQRGVADELAGAVRLDFEPGGVRCTMEIPLGPPSSDAGW
jgi:PAS domain S-box-containing protein